MFASACCVIKNVGFEDLDLKNVQLYPNPTAGALTVTFDGAEANVLIMDAAGKTLKTASIHSGNTLSLVEFANGIYFVAVTIDNVTSVTRIQKY